MSVASLARRKTLGLLYPNIAAEIDGHLGVRVCRLRPRCGFGFPTSGKIPAPANDSLLFLTSR